LKGFLRYADRDGWEDFANEDGGWTLQPGRGSGHSDAEWRARLTPASYAVLRQHSTEAPGSSPLDHEKRAGTYLCAGCELALFDAKTKFDSGTGWPSFYEPLKDAVEMSQDFSMIVPRTEVHCRRCGGHLGHVFDDGPKPTGLRFCMNGVALDFKVKPA
jgi:peptide-methionine (R)-S-oxide reductase